MTIEEIVNRSRALQAFAEGEAPLPPGRDSARQKSADVRAVLKRLSELDAQVAQLVQP